MPSLRDEGLYRQTGGRRFTLGDTTKVIHHDKFPVIPAKQLFIISDEVLRPISTAEVLETVKVLRTLDLYRLPYPTVDVRMQADHLMKSKDHEEKFGPDGICTFYGISTTPGVPFRLVFHWETNKHWWGEMLPDEYRLSAEGPPNIITTRRVPPDGLREFMANVLVVLLATKNAVKETSRDKLAHLGIGRSKGRHEYTTTLHLPRQMEDHPEHEPIGPGTRKCPHLRRGHIRNQRYGPGFEFTRQVFIEPCFVNADEEWTKTRTAYNVSL